MHTLNIDKKSWHYKIASLFGSETVYCFNLCDYSRLVFYHLLMMCLALFAVVTFGLVPIGDFIAWLVASVAAGSMLPLDLPALIFVAFGLAFGGFALFVSGILLSRKLNIPTFMSEAIDSFKSKTCIRISIDHKND